MLYRHRGDDESSGHNGRDFPPASCVGVAVLAIHDIAHLRRITTTGYMAMPINRIRALRDARGLTLAELAEMIGSTPQQINRWELGTRPLRYQSMQRLAEAFGVPPGALFMPLEQDESGPIKQGTKVRLSDEEVALVTYWRLLDRREKIMFASHARIKGVEILPTTEPAPTPPRHLAVG